VAALFVGYIALVVHPTPSQLHRALPANLGDPALIVWILRWGAHSLTTSPLHYFDAGIFWPHRAALAYSDPITPLVPVYALFYGVTGSWAMALNLSVLSLVLFTLSTTYALARFLTGRTDAAIIAALGLGAGAYAQAHFGHIQLQTMGFLPLGFLLLFKLLDRPRMSTAVLLAVTNAALVLSALYYGAIYAVCVVVIVGAFFLARRFRPGPGLIVPLLVTGALTGVLLAPAAVSYLKAQHDQHLVRGLEPGYGLNPADLVTPALGNALYEGIHRSSAPDNVEHRFFPGFVSLLLGAVGLAALAMSFVRRRRSPVDDEADGVGDPDESKPLYMGLLLLAGLVALLLSLGPTVAGHAAPYRIFHDHVPGFAGIRVTSRLAVVTLIAGAALAGWGWMALTERVPRRLLAVLSALVVVALAAEGYAHRTWAYLPSDRSALAVYRTLAHRPRAAVVELPMADPRTQGVAWPFVESPRMIYATIDWKPRVNGYSGFLPPDYLVDINDFNQFPAAAAVARAKTLGVRYLILHVGDEHGFPAYSDAEARSMVSHLPVGAVAFHRGNGWLVDLGPDFRERR
jgi:hypothetical protein